ncbi:ferritin family protein [Pseudothermotoga thermarum]|uniref:Rubrerythrin n=1 Tax=Pseudothermotoga thermarum DSM 5069 TaxID=688269 RepID=F7YWI5_9THEM|nr:ferritin family protein [Pseudothermotoga thermarum]AEH51966.1 rubrerythrin [Pseudothermotoga thermarum DSM 5069]
MKRDEKELLKLLLAHEIQWRDFYKLKADFALTKTVKDLFTQFSKIEDEHIKRLFDFVEISSFDFSNTTFENFPTYVTTLKLYPETSVRSDLPLLEAAYMMEHDLTLLCQKIADVISNETVKRFLLNLMELEKHQRDVLKNLHEEFLQQFWWEQGFYPVL